MKSRTSIFIASCLGMLLFGIALITLGSVAPYLTEKFSLNAIDQGSLFSILPFGILTGSLVFGPIADRKGYKIILVVSCLLMFGGFLGIAYASSLWLLKVSIYFFGLGGGGLNGGANAVVSDISETNKGANMSLIGVFFAIGALGMPVVLGLLENTVSQSTILAIVAHITLGIAILYLLVSFPPPKQKQDFSLVQFGSLAKDTFLLMIGFFLFCQSGFEAIINNWTTTYFAERLNTESSQALYALSLYVTGMAVMRLLIGSALRSMKPGMVLLISFFALFAGTALIYFAGTYTLAVAGLVALGVGLAAGFPVMLGFVGEQYREMSGTAFSIAISIALIGNMIINYTVGQVIGNYGIVHLTTVTFTLSVVMMLLSLLIIKRVNKINIINK